MQPLLKQVGKYGKTSVVIAAICTACVSASAANATTVSFVLKDSNKAINVWLDSNASYRFDGYPRAFVLDYNPNDREQRFNELPGNQGGKLYQVEGTNLCLNNAYNYNDAPINVWPCNPNDRDQNWRQINLAGSIHLQNFTTGRCADSPFRNLDPKNLHAWDCMPGNRNQQFNVVVRGGGNTLPTSAAAANFAFKTQYKSTYNPDGPDLSGNCGPTSLAIILKLLGLEKPGLTVQQSINEASRLMGRQNPNWTTWAELETGIRNAGGKPENLNSKDAIDRSLAAGKPIIANGYYGENWRRQFPSYQLTGSGNVAHINTILGRTADGRYIVADPMYSGGTVEMNWNQLAVYFSNGVAGIAFAR
ncbi:MAG TPA: ricin-type beta-trefoil lectin domain protein [Coleofasciculaceae cyanobacterium]